jgi:hypothetical protein
VCEQHAESNAYQHKRGRLWYSDGWDSSHVKRVNPRDIVRMQSNEDVAHGEERPHHGIRCRRVIQSERVADFVKSEQFEIVSIEAEVVSDLPPEVVVEKDVAADRLWIWGRRKVTECEKTRRHPTRFKVEVDGPRLMRDAGLGESQSRDGCPHVESSDQSRMLHVQGKIGRGYSEGKVRSSLPSPGPSHPSPTVANGRASGALPRRPRTTPIPIAARCRLGVEREYDRARFRVTIG